MKNDKCMKPWFRAMTILERTEHLRECFGGWDCVEYKDAMDYYFYGYDAELVKQDDKEEGFSTSDDRYAYLGLIELLNSDLVCAAAICWNDFYLFFSFPDQLFDNLKSNQLRYEVMDCWYKKRVYLLKDKIFTDFSKPKDFYDKWKAKRYTYKMLAEQDKKKTALEKKSSRKVQHKVTNYITIQPGSTVIFNDIHDNTNPTIQ